ncbi:tRNA (N6-isopentenyl adenosine(37)-C2)-methylthiotransferase MiaB [Mycobacterium sp. NBC_00419]
MTSVLTQGSAAGDPARSSAGRSYQVRTYGCQMNVHDSERLAGLLEAAGYRRAAEGEDADVVVFNTCAVRENADNKLYGNISHLAPRKQADPDMQIAVGGCLAQKDREGLLKKAPWVDVVFGTHNIGSLPALLDRARHNREAQVEIAESLREFPSTLPAARESAYAAWVSISVGCNNTCTFCIVPALRGKEVDRRPTDILAEVRSLVDQGVLEVTLLGQNVNAYGVSFAAGERLRESPMALSDTPRDRGAFAALLRSCGDIDGLERVRFTSPHPAEFTDDVIEAMAQTPNVCPALHMPLQSGSDRVLRAMRRSYRAEKYLGIIERVRAAMPHAAITTDIIVGFPGETEDDFAATLEVVRAARFAAAFTFQYSKRPGTPAAELDGQLPKAVVQERYERLIELQEQISFEENAAQIGAEVELLVATGEGRKDASTARMSGRARDGRLVHFSPGDTQVRPGDILTTTVTGAAPHHLIADAPLLSYRRTRAGDAHAAGQRPRTTGLGLPSVGRPAAGEPTGCGQ